MPAGRPTADGVRDRLRSLLGAETPLVPVDFSEALPAHPSAPSAVDADAAGPCAHPEGVGLCRGARCVTLNPPGPAPVREPAAGRKSGPELRAHGRIPHRADEGTLPDRLSLPGDRSRGSRPQCASRQARGPVPPHSALRTRKLLHQTLRTPQSAFRTPRHPFRCFTFRCGWWAWSDGFTWCWSPTAAWSCWISTPRMNGFFTNRCWRGWRERATHRPSDFCCRKPSSYHPATPRSCGHFCRCW
jgi:hypothetical protein